MRKSRAIAAMKAAMRPKAGVYEREAMRKPARIGPAASPLSQMVPNMPIAEPRRPALTRSATRAVVDGVTMATPRPKSADAGKRSQNDANARIAGSVTAHRKRPATIIGLRPSRSESLPESGLAGMGGGQLAPLTSAL